MHGVAIKWRDWEVQYINTYYVETNLFNVYLKFANIKMSNGHTFLRSPAGDKEGKKTYI